jgi:eukaryotic-like serine/threonine-protein kinase
MPLQIGAVLGPYQILEPAGAGGMGEVFKAKDTRLDRIVAVKVLSTDLIGSQDLKQRFEREARAISSLQHPHICTLFDVGSHEGIEYLVMEFLEGETLSSRIEKGPLPIQQVMKIGAEIADALDRAHRQGILHRDLKPGNVMLTKSGAKLLDFGLAKPLAMAGTASGISLTAALTRSSPASPITQAGTIVGTFQYMSPEQLEGKDPDARSDIFALGAVLYEMATGKRAFEGKSQISVMSAILEKEPEPVSKIQPTSPAAFDHVVTRALAKDPDERWQTAADVRSELKWIAQSSSASQAALPEIKRNRFARLPLWAAATLAIALLAATALMFTRREAPLVQTFILPPEEGEFAFTGQGAGPPAISPDGKKVVFQAAGADGKRLLWVKSIDSLTPLPLARTENAMYPFWSPDSKQVGFFQGGHLRRVDVAGGPVTNLAQAASARGGTWTKSGLILFTPGTGDGIFKVAASGGTPVSITKLQAPETSHRWPHALPDGKHFLYLAWDQGASNLAVMFSSVDEDKRQLVLTDATNVTFAEDHLFFVRAGVLLVQRFDSTSGKLTGDPQPLFERVQTDPQFGRANYSVSQSGPIIFSLGASTAEAQLQWYSIEGRELATLGVINNWTAPRLSPDGNMLAVSADGGNQDVWLINLSRQISSRFTFDPAPDVSPIWPPDSKSVLFTRVKTGANRLITKAADGSGAESTLLERPEMVQPSDWSRDGKYISFNMTSPGHRSDLWILPMFGDRKPYAFIATEFGEADGMFSPDGKWLVYDSAISGLSEIYATPFPGGGAKFQISSGGGDWPRWTKDGKQVLYESGGYLYIADVRYDATSLQVTGTRKLFSAPFVSNASNYFYDVAADKRLLFIATQGKRVEQRLAYISDWKQQLNK